VWVDAEPLGGSGVEVRPLGEQALADLRRRGCLAAQVRASAAALTPSFWAGQELLAAPPLGYFATAEARRSLHAEFIGLPAPKRK
jgi:hypothetical protein